jgi:hypothetical protein
VQGYFFARPGDHAAAQAFLMSKYKAGASSFAAQPCGGTLIKFQHLAFGLISDEHREGVVKGWTYMNDGVRKHAEAKRRPQ